MPNKKIVPFYLIFTVLFAAIGFIEIIYTEPTKFAFNGVVQYILLGAFTLVFLCNGIIALIEYYKTLFDTSATISILEEKLVDKHSLFSLGDIFYSDITSIGIYELLGMKYLFIHIKKDSIHLNKYSPQKRFLIKRRLKRTRNGIMIFQRRINFDIYKLHDIVIERMPTKS